MPAVSSGGRTLAEEVGAIEWYHTLELAPGVVTPGWFDTRPTVAEVPFAPTLEGSRCLDVATFNGFWAFEMERRGADEVIAIDVLDPSRWDWPAGADEEVIATMATRQAGGRGFDIAKRELGSSVERLERSVYELDPDDVGSFDLVYLGSLLIHLRDPIRALERVRSVCRGTLIVVDGIDPLLSAALPRLAVATIDGEGRPWWWYPNTAALARWLRIAGFDVVEGPRRIYIQRGGEQPRPGLDPRLLFSREGRMALTVALKGDPHAVLSARPRPGLGPVS